MKLDQRTTQYIISIVTLFVLGFFLIMSGQELVPEREVHIRELMSTTEYIIYTVFSYVGLGCLTLAIGIIGHYMGAAAYARKNS